MLIKQQPLCENRGKPSLAWDHIFDDARLRQRRIPMYDHFNGKHFLLGRLLLFLLKKWRDSKPHHNRYSTYQWPHLHGERFVLFLQEKSRRSDENNPCCIPTARRPYSPSLLLLQRTGAIEVRPRLTTGRSFA
jgi:hypothetical protein